MIAPPSSYRHTPRAVITEPERTEETTGTWSTRQIEQISSIISIKCASITVITLTRQMWSERLWATFQDGKAPNPSERRSIG